MKIGLFVFFIFLGIISGCESKEKKSNTREISSIKDERMAVMRLYKKNEKSFIGINLENNEIISLSEIKENHSLQSFLVLPKKLEIILDKNDLIIREEKETKPLLHNVSKILKVYPDGPDKILLDIVDIFKTRRKITYFVGLRELDKNETVLDKVAHYSLPFQEGIIKISPPYSQTIERVNKEGESFILYHARDGQYIENIFVLNEEKILVCQKSRFKEELSLGIISENKKKNKEIEYKNISDGLCF